MVGMTFDNKLERVWKEVVVTISQVLSWHWLGGFDECHENPLDSRSLGWTSTSWSRSPTCLH